MAYVLIVTGWLDVSGTETFIMNVLRGLDRNRIKVDFLLFHHKETRYSKEAESMGCNLFYLPSRNTGPLNYLNHLNRFFATNAKKYDIVHYCGGSLTSVAPMFFAKRHGVKTIIAHAHSSSNDGIHNKILHSINKRIFQNLFTHRWACSKEAGKYFFGNKDYQIIHNGIDTIQFRFNNLSRISTRESLNISRSDIVFGHIGRFITLKNQSFVVDIFNQFHKKNTNSKLILVGIGPEQESVKRKVKKLGLHNNVIFTGERSDIPELLCAMDCFIMPSIYEGLPFVLVEAQATGLTCIVSDSISHDAKITDHLHFFNLSKNAQEWCNEISSILSIASDRKDNSIFIRSGYDIKSTIEYVQSSYLKSSE